MVFISPDQGAGYFWGGYLRGEGRLTSILNIYSRSVQIQIDSHLSHEKKTPYFPTACLMGILNDPYIAYIYNSFLQSPHRWGSIIPYIP